VLGQVTRQHGFRVEFEGHRLLSGSNVINLVSPDKCSVIQMARALRVLPDGVFSTA
jgi:hypothetical protein